MHPPDTKVFQSEALVVLRGTTWYHVVQAWTNDEFLSNVHRVANPPPGAGHSESITMHFQLANLTQGKICEVQCGFVVQTPFRAG